MHQLETIRAVFAAGRFDFTEHATERAVGEEHQRAGDSGGWLAGHYN